MAKSSFQALVVFSILSGLCCYTGEAVAWTKVPAIFAFGDSLIDSGTNNFIEGSTTLANYLPYGKDFLPHRRPTGRFTNGRHTVDFIASRLGLRLIPAFLNPQATFFQGVNFGSGGSGILSTTGGDGVVPLDTQLDQLEQVAAQLTSTLGGAAAADLISNSLFLFSTGNNDLLAYLGNGTLQQISSPTQFVTNLLSQLQLDIQIVYALGARKIVLLGIGPLGCAPQAMAAVNATNGQCVAAPNELAQAYNVALLQLQAGLQSELPDVHVVIASTFDTLESLINNGTATGFTQGSKACCGSGLFNGAVRCGPNNTTSLCENVNNHVFWDSIHPTERVHRHFANLMWDGDSSVIQPVNLKTLAQL